MLTDEAVNFMTKNTDGNSPFFLYLACNAPHSPLQGKTEDLQFLYPDHKPANPGNGVDYRDYEPRPNYAAMVYAVDRGVATITEAFNNPNKDGDVDDGQHSDCLSQR